MYGAIKEVRKSLDELKGNDAAGDQRALFQPMEILCGIFWPFMMFIYIYRFNLAKERYKNATGVAIFTWILPILFNCWYSRRMYQNLRRGNCRRWKLVLNVVLWFVIFFAIGRSDTAYWRYKRGYFDFQAMASYINVDPSTDRGQSYMDAGQVYFKEGSGVAKSKAIAFQEDQVYCAAPIVQQSLDSGGDSSGNSLSGNSLNLPKSGTIDFWAVGINCCDPSGLNFHCGETNNVFARAGIRELRDDSRPYFLMAVQEWTATLQMPAKHPLFFHWVQDPLRDVENMSLEADKMFIIDGFRVLVLGFLGTFFFQYLFYNLGV